MPTGGQAPIRPFAVIEGLEFPNGTIEAEIAGAPAPGAGEGARGFVGIAFRLQKDMTTSNVFYLRPRTAVPTIRSGGIMPFNTRHRPIGRGSGCGKSSRPCMRPTSISCRSVDQDQDQDRRPRGARTSLRLRPGTAYADRQ
jgi:hypothetical protein